MLRTQGDIDHAYSIAILHPAIEVTRFTGNCRITQAAEAVTRNYYRPRVVEMGDMTNEKIGNRMSPDSAARQALRVALAEVLVVADNWRHIHLDAKPGADTAEAAEMLSQILGLLADRARGALDADGANIDILVEWALADIADELT